MRILSKNHDYYDTALAFGHDTTVVFERVEERYERGEIPSEYKAIMLPSLSPRAYHHIGGPYTRGRRNGFDTGTGHVELCYYPFTVAFCGKLYPGIEVASRHRGRYDWNLEHYYDFDSYAAFMTEMELEWHDAGKKRYHYGGGRGSVRKEQDVQAFFAKRGNDHVTWFAERGKPIAVYFEEDGHEPSLTFNGELKRYSFYKVFNAYTTFQELDMFISGVMARDDSAAMARISDENLRDQKGFDDMSFKKYPTKKR